MAQYVTIPSPLTAANLTALSASQTAITNILEAAKVPLTPEQEDALISVSIKRESEINDVNTIFIKNNPDLVPKKVSITNYQQNLVTVATLKQIHAAQIDAANQTEKIIKAILHNQILDARLVIANAEVVAKNDSSVDDMVDDYKEKHHSRSATAVATEMDIATDAKVTVANVVTKKAFVNEGSVILTLAKEGGLSTEVVKVNPAGSAIVPKGWTTVVVTNLSKTEPGKFSLYIAH